MKLTVKRRRPGRPATGINRKHIVTLRFTDEELKKIDKYVSQNDFSGRSPMIRSVLMERLTEDL